MAAQCLAILGIWILLAVDRARWNAIEDRIDADRAEWSKELKDVKAQVAEPITVIIEPEPVLRGQLPAIDPNSPIPADIVKFLEGKKGGGRGR